MDLVYDWAFLYALKEMISGDAFNSNELDLLLVFDPEHATRTKREIYIWKIAERYSSDASKLKNLNLLLEETEEIAKTGKYLKEAQNEGKHKAKG